MFQIGTKWQLLDLPKKFEKEIVEISLRGYLKEFPIAISSQFAKMNPLSISDIATTICPTRRDLYLYKKERKEGEKTWGRTAGHLVEKYIKCLIEEFPKYFISKKKHSYSQLNKCIYDFTKKYVENNSNKFNALKKPKDSDEETPEKLALFLEYTGRYELAMLGADWILRAKQKKEKALFDSALSLQYKDTEVKIKSNEKVLGIKDPATPDFILKEVKAIGDIKTGKEFKDFYKLIAAGYALAYESQNGAGNDINFGVIYFFETRSKDLIFAQIRVFVIDNFLRRQFLQLRNESFKILQQNHPPPFADKEKDCKGCKFDLICNQRG